MLIYKEISRQSAREGRLPAFANRTAADQTVRTNILACVSCLVQARYPFPLPYEGSTTTGAYRHARDYRNICHGRYQPV